MVFNKQQGEHEIEVMKLTHKFALRMASIISMSVVSAITISGIFFGATTPIALGVLFLVAIIMGILIFSSTRSALI